MPSPTTKAGVKQHIAATTAPQLPTFKHFSARLVLLLITTAFQISV
jgi:hypothetical protein